MPRPERTSAADRRWLQVLKLQVVKLQALKLQALMLDVLKLQALKLQLVKLDVLKAIMFSAFAAALVWGVVSRTFAAFLAEGSPEQALRIRPAQPAALDALAETRLSALDGAERTAREAASSPTLAIDRSLSEGGSSPNTGGIAPERGPQPDRARTQDVREAQSLASQALLADPLNARALRILGQIADLSGDEAQALRFMQAAARRSLNETMAVAWMMSKSAEDGDYPEAIRYADILLRSRPQLRQAVVPFLAWMAEQGGGGAGLKDMLSRNPPWRAQFFDALPASVSDARTPLDLLMAVKDSPAPPTTVELRGYLDFLIGRQLYALAYYAWLQFLLPEQLSSVRYVVNGGFEAPPSALPFDWSISQGAGTTVGVDLSPGEGANHALFVRFDDGRAEFSGVAQLLVLSPATYRLAATYKGTLLGRRGLKWRVTCVGGTTGVIGESPTIAGTSASWKPLELSFSVPGSDCPAQYVRLELDARMASERFVSGEVWFDNLQISRVDGRWKSARWTRREGGFTGKWRHEPEN